MSVLLFTPGGLFLLSLLLSRLHGCAGSSCPDQNHTTNLNCILSPFIFDDRGPDRTKYQHSHHLTVTEITLQTVLGIRLFESDSKTLFSIRKQKKIISVYKNEPVYFWTHWGQFRIVCSVIFKTDEVIRWQKHHKNAQTQITPELCFNHFSVW